MSEWLFDIANETWELTTLGEACQRGGGNIQTGPFGSQLHASDYVSVGIPSIMPQNLSGDRISTDGVSRITLEDAERLSRYRVQTGDIVYSRRGDVERRALVTENENGWLCGTGCLRVRFGQGIVDPMYAYYYLGHPNVREWVVRHAIGATLPNLNTSILSALPFVLPSLEEQQYIGSVLGSLDDKIELNRRENETLEAMARALFKSWFVDFDPVRAKMEVRPPTGMDAETAALFPDTFEESALGLIPAGWQVGKLGEYCSVARGASPRPIQQYMDGSVPWIKIADATAANGPFLFETKEKLKAEGKAMSVFLNKGTLILSNSATCGVPIFLDIDGCIHDGWLYFPELRGISQLYLYYILLELAEYLVHIADGSVQKNLNTELVRSQSIIVPSLEILGIFNDLASQLLNKVLENGRSSRTLADVRDALLPKLLSGEVRIEEVNDAITH